MPTAINVTQDGGGTSNARRGGYRTDQFFALRGEGPIGNGNKPIKPSNPPFLYPDRTVRVYKNGEPAYTQLKRGYIRNLTTSAEASAAGIRKCQFQFNPTQLNQSVSMMQGMLNPMQQDPGQLAQPMNASQNFSFNLFFDRSMEINNDPGIVTVGGESFDTWAQNSPGQVGVLRDLSALYSVIGQGLSVGQRDYMVKVLKDTLKAEASVSMDEDAATQLERANTNVTDFLSINIGNSAFLLPVPVRVVFSSLFVVEGLVSNTSVVFTKFSSSLIPMQCYVTVTMEAKYIGFSKKKTFFTEVLAQREKMEVEQKKAEAAAKNEVITAISSACKTMRLAFYAPTVAQQTTETHDFHTLESLLLADNTLYKVGVDSIPTAKEKGDGDGVKALFESGELVSLSRYAEASLYGPFSSPPPTQSGPGRKPVDLAAWAKKNGTELVATAYFSPDEPGNGMCLQWKEWGDFINVGYNAPRSHTKNSSMGGPVTFDINTSYFVIRWKGKINAKLSNGEYLTGSGERWVLVGPGSAMDGKALTYDLQLMWPKAVVDGTAAAQGSNAATDPKPAGSTNNKPPAAFQVGVT